MRTANRCRRVHARTSLTTRCLPFRKSAYVTKFANTIRCRRRTRNNEHNKTNTRAQLNYCRVVTMLLILKYYYRCDYYCRRNTYHLFWSWPFFIVSTTIKFARWQKPDKAIVYRFGLHKDTRADYEKQLANVRAPIVRQKTSRVRWRGYRANGSKTTPLVPHIEPIKENNYISNENLWVFNRFGGKRRM